MQANRKASRERPNQDRRDELLRVAARLFAENGFRGTSMDDIAREMGILKGSLYYWIDSKEALLAEVLAGATQEAIDEAGEILAMPLPARERLRKLIHSHIRSWVKNPDNFNVSLREYRWLEGAHAARLAEEREQLEDAYKQLVREGVERGEFRARPEQVSLIVNLLFGAMNWFPRWYRSDGAASADAIADILADLVLDGLLRDGAAAEAPALMRLSPANGDQGHPGARHRAG
jgi:AcrR family transcriptional regulator